VGKTAVKGAPGGPRGRPEGHEASRGPVGPAAGADPEAAAPGEGAKGDDETRARVAGVRVFGRGVRFV